MHLSSLALPATRDRSVCLLLESRQGLGLEMMDVRKTR